MLKANFKSLFFITLITTLALLSGCSSPEEKKAAQIKEAVNLSEEGATAQALQILEELAVLYPNDIQILSSMGQIYADQGDPAMAAFFLEQAYLQSPDDIELLFQTYQSLQSAKQPSGHLLEKLAVQAPEVMTPELWIRLGQNRKAENKVQAALDAYLKGVDPDKQKPTPETAAAIGQLFVEANNLAQAETWLAIAADYDDPNALTALFGLLEINLRQKDWVGAEAIVAQLEKQFPGAIKASQWQQAREELVAWRKAQDAMKAKLAQAEKKAAAEAEKLQAAKPEAPKEDPNTAADGSESATSAPETADTESKTQVVADLEAAEAMANAPAIEVEESTETAAVTAAKVEKAIAFNPSIAIEPADPEITFEVEYDQAPTAEETTYAVETVTPVEPATAQTIEAFPVDPVDQTEPTDSSPQSGQPRTIEELMADAETAEIDRDFKTAIRKYWAAISINNSRADIWNLLSRAYLVDGQLNNAETTALEAVRLEPREVAYTLDYLRVAQRSKEPTNFLAELETAYARFPASPEITLSLARGHERISKDRATARNLYLRFIDIAPNHPLIPEARKAAAQLR